jgi:hypothetical protein
MGPTHLSVGPYRVSETQINPEKKEKRNVKNFIPTYFVMVAVIKALLRLRNMERNNETFPPWVPILSRQMERKCDYSGYGCWESCSIASHKPLWQPTGELKVLVDKGYATMDGRTGEVRPTKTFDFVAKQVLDDTQKGPSSYPPSELFCEVSNLNGHDPIDPDTQMTQLEPWEEEHTFFEADDSPQGFRLRNVICEIEPCPLCKDYNCPGPHYCD